MPISINGNGTITGISTGGLPDGCVDTDTLANNAVTSAKSTGLQRRITTGPTNMSGSSVTFTLTAGVKQIEILFHNFSSDNSSDVLLQIGDAGGIETSGYGYAAGYHRTGLSSREATVAAYTTAFTTNGFGSSSYQIWGTWKLCNPNGNFWYAEHNMWGSLADDHTFYGNGYKELSDTITQFKMTPNSGSFDSGTFTVIETMGDT